jgi:ferredoxin--NADP+ reductase
VSQTLGTAARPLRVAIVGAGPAGFYAAEALLKQKDLVCSIDFFNRFPTPFGLVREGVAPDHPSIKAVTRIYDKIARSEHVRYFGNVSIGSDIAHSELMEHYDQVVYAVGAQSDRRMGIPGEDLAGSVPATAFVGWYNGRPDYRDMEFDLSCERVVVVGNGNVAMDVTRILAKSTDELAETDICDYALEALRNSKVREVVMLGRRGPAQAAFTNPELKEFGELEGVDVIIDPADLELDPQSEESLAGNKTAQKNVEMLREFAARTERNAPRRIVMRFLVSPVEIIGQDGKVSAVRIERNKLAPDDKGVMRPQGTGEFETFDAGMVLRSVGYKGIPVEGVPFNQRSATINNEGGRVCDTENNQVVPGVYVVGWAKRGPSGVIGTNKPDAVATVKAMVEDVANLPGVADEKRDPALIINLLQERTPDYTTYADWDLLDKYEVATGGAQGRPRIKVTRVPEMIEVIKKGRAG